MKEDRVFTLLLLVIIVLIMVVMAFSRPWEPRAESALPTLAYVYVPTCNYPWLSIQDEAARCAIEEAQRKHHKGKDRPQWNAKGWK